MNPDQVLARARQAIGQGCVYKLGAGGRKPFAPLPWIGPPECDCSGFVAWCLGVDRHTDNPWYKNQNGGWIETTAICRDSDSPYGIFTKVKWEDALPGMLVVYGDRVIEGTRRQGHVGIVTAVDHGPSHVIHCSLGNWHKTGDAIQETGPAAWKARGDAIVAACGFVEAERSA